MKLIKFNYRKADKMNVESLLKNHDSCRWYGNISSGVRIDKDCSCVINPYYSTPFSASWLQLGGDF